MALRNITLSQSGQSVSLRSDLDFEVEYEEVSKTAVMASGRIVKDIVGQRKIINVPVGYMPPADVRKLKAMINSGLPISVTFPGIDGPDGDIFYSSQPTYRASMYGPDGVTVWLGMELHLRGVEVEK